MMRRLSSTLAAAAITLAGIGATNAADLSLGLISNRTGPTSDIGIPHADGVLDAWKWQNAQGGIDGRKVEIVEIECGYNVDCTKAAFTFLTEEEQVPLMHGFGTPDSIAVIPLTNREKTVYMPLSYAEELVDAENAPYMFVTNADYSTAGRSAVQFVKAEGGSLALARFPEGFGIAPIPAIKDEAALIGVDIVAEFDIDYVPTDAVNEVVRIKESGATHVWLGNTNTSMSVLAAELERQSVDAKIIGNIYAGDEAFIEHSHEMAEGHFAMYGSVHLDERNIPMIQEIRKAGHRGADNTHYIRGWAQGLLAGAAIEQALKTTSADDLTGEAVRQAMYELGSFSAANLVPPVTFSPDDHRPNMVGDVYKVENGRWEKYWENELPR
ncbi:MAG: ABC transporter substrate-binding protein [Pseudomonadota bacterium]